SPSSLSLIDRVVRCSSLIPARSSRKAIARLTAAGERPSLRAAAARLPSSTATTNTFIASRRSMTCSQAEEERAKVNHSVTLQRPPRLNENPISLNSDHHQNSAMDGVEARHEWANAFRACHGATAMDERGA